MRWRNRRSPLESVHVSDEKWEGANVFGQAIQTDPAASPRKPKHTNKHSCTLHTTTSDSQTRAEPATKKKNWPSCGRPVRAAP